MSLRGKVYGCLKRSLGAVLGAFLAILVIGSFLLPSCMTQRAWREEVTERYCVPDRIEDTSIYSWRALCRNGRVMHCYHGVTTTETPVCTEVP